MNEVNEVWVPVLVTRLNQAQALWDAWLKDHGVTRADLGPLDVQQEIVRVEHGTESVIRVREAALRRLFARPPQPALGLTSFHGTTVVPGVFLGTGNDVEWVEVVALTNLTKANTTWKAWLRENSLAEADLGSEEMVQAIFRSKEGVVSLYLVRRSVIERLPNVNE
jgi:hypothetical protein